MTESNDSDGEINAKSRGQLRNFRYRYGQLKPSPDKPGMLVEPNGQLWMPVENATVEMLVLDGLKAVDRLVVSDSTEAFSQNGS